MVPSFEHAYSKSELRPLGLEHTATPVHCDSLDAPTGLVGLDVGQSKHVFVYDFVRNVNNYIGISFSFEKPCVSLFSKCFAQKSCFLLF